MILILLEGSTVALPSLNEAQCITGDEDQKPLQYIHAAMEIGHTGLNQGLLAAVSRRGYVPALMATVSTLMLRMKHSKVREHAGRRYQ